MEHGKDCASRCRFGAHLVLHVTALRLQRVWFCEGACSAQRAAVAYLLITVMCSHFPADCYWTNVFPIREHWHHPHQDCGSRQQLLLQQQQQQQAGGTTQWMLAQRVNATFVRTRCISPRPKFISFPTRHVPSTALLQYYRGCMGCSDFVIGGTAE